MQVSWARFGERSTADLQWQILKEAIGSKVLGARAGA
jgi:hypothetical protein